MSRILYTLIFINKSCDCLKLQVFFIYSHFYKVISNYIVLEWGRTDQVMCPQVTLDVLSYHATAPLEEAVNLSK
jgi:hypothetical protein